MSLKKLIIAAVVVAILAIVGIVVYLFTDLNAIAKRQIESYGSSLTGSAVWIESVDISPRSGAGTIRGLHISNPPGFSSGDAITLDRIHLKIEPMTLTGNPIVIDLVAIDAPQIQYEVSGGHSNISTLVDNVKKSGSDDGASKKADSDSDATRLVLRRVQFSKGEMKASASELFGQGLDITLPKFSMSNVGGSRGAPPAEVGKKILSAYGTKIAVVMAATQIQKTVSSEAEKASKKLPGPAGEAVGDVLDGVFKLVPGSDN